MKTANTDKKEKILWEGSPDSRKIFGRNDRILIPCSLLWLAVAMYWVFWMTESSDASYNFLFGFLFIMAGLYLVVLRFAAKITNKKNSAYRITDKAVYLKNKENKDFITVPLREITGADLIEETGGCGTVFLERNHQSAGKLLRLLTNAGLEFMMGEEPVYGMYDLPDARKVYDLIREHSFEKKKYGG